MTKIELRLVRNQSHEVMAGLGVRFETLDGVPVRGIWTHDDLEAHHRLYEKGLGPKMHQQVPAQVWVESTPARNGHYEYYTFEVNRNVQTST